ncbi:MAG: DJ-1/PfpI family protein [Gammaproteobacteria bacterium]|nr:DJ-1/PfpI family protein [Gammaproteobacteria bacterium]
MASVLVPLAEGFEEIEATTVIDLLRRAGVDVDTAALDQRLVTGSRGIPVQADCLLDQALQRDYDMIALPGGQPGSDNLAADRRIIELLQNMAGAGKHVAAICAAPKVLHAAGLLAGRNATAFPGALEQADDVTVLDDVIVRDGRVLTSRGPGTAMDFALCLVETLCGREKRDEVESRLQRP